MTEDEFVEIGKEVVARVMAVEAALQTHSPGNIHEGALDLPCDACTLAGALRRERERLAQAENWIDDLTERLKAADERHAEGAQDRAELIAERDALVAAEAVIQAARDVARYAGVRVYTGVRDRPSPFSEPQPPLVDAGPLVAALAAYDAALERD